MSNSSPSLGNLDSITRATQLQSALMTETTDSSSSFIGSSNTSGINSQSLAQIIESIANPNPEESLPEIPGTTIVTRGVAGGTQVTTGLPNLAEEVKAALNSTNLNTMLNRMSNNPAEVSKMMEQSMGQMNPNMMEQAQKLAMSGLVFINE